MVRVNISAGREQAWLDVARQAEALGVHELRVADHLVTGLHAPFSALAAAAAVTDTLRVGTYVLNNDLRHPVVVATEAATLAELSGGRFTLGLGAGHMKAEYDASGLVFDPAAVRVRRLAESADLVRRLLAGGHVDHEGVHYRVHTEVRNCADPPVRLLIGGHGTEVLRTAARVADVVGFTGFSPQGDGTESDLSKFSEVGLAERATVVRGASDGRTPAFDLLVQHVEITDRPDVALDRLAGRLQLPVEMLRSSPFVLIGPVDAIADRVEDLAIRHRVSEITVFVGRTGQTLASLAPLIERLAG